MFNQFNGESSSQTNKNQNQWGGGSTDAWANANMNPSGDPEITVWAREDEANPDTEVDSLLPNEERDRIESEIERLEKEINDAQATKREIEERAKVESIPEDEQKVYFALVDTIRSDEKAIEDLKEQLQKDNAARAAAMEAAANTAAEEATDTAENAKDNKGFKKILGRAGIAALAIVAAAGIYFAGKFASGNANSSADATKQTEASGNDGETDPSAEYKEMSIGDYVVDYRNNYADSTGFENNKQKINQFAYGPELTAEEMNDQEAVRQRLKATFYDAAEGAEVFFFARSNKGESVADLGALSMTDLEDLAESDPEAYDRMQKDNKYTIANASFRKTEYTGKAIVLGAITSGSKALFGDQVAPENTMVTKNSDAYFENKTLLEVVMTDKLGNETVVMLIDPDCVNPVIPEGNPDLEEKLTDVPEEKDITPPEEETTTSETAPPSGEETTTSETAPPSTEVGTHPAKNTEAESQYAGEDAAPATVDPSQANSAEEASRIAAENERQMREEAARKAEEARKASEEAVKREEAARIAEEALRAAEEAKKADEESKAREEEARQQSEAAAAAAEAARQASEAADTQDDYNKNETKVGSSGNDDMDDDDLSGLWGGGGF